MNETLTYYRQLHKRLWEIAYPSGGWEESGKPQLQGMDIPEIKAEIKELLTENIRIMHEDLSDRDILEQLLFNNKD